MAESTAPRLGAFLQAYRKRTGKTQSELGETLGISQVHVSRVERGLNISPELAAQIRKLVGIAAEVPAFSLHKFEDNFWNIAYVVHPDDGGDRIWFSDASLDKILALHCDAAGSDQQAATMAEHLIAGFEAAIASNLEASISTESLYAVLNEMVKRTKDFWTARPSAHLIEMRRDHGRLSIVNAGMPDILYYDSTKRDMLAIDEKVAPIGAGKSAARSVTSYTMNMVRGDVMFLYSDGFKEEFERKTRQSLGLNVLSFCRALNGDAEGIAAKLLKVFQGSTDQTDLRDDVSFMALSRT